MLGKQLWGCELDWTALRLWPILESGIGSVELLCQRIGHLVGLVGCLV